MFNLSVIEINLQNHIFPDLEKGRPDWDLPHTKAVVHWTKQILPETTLDPLVSITASYAHDWGYIGLFPDGASYDQIQKMKPLHMERGAEMIKTLLMGDELTSSFTQAQIDRVAHLVSVHDKLKQLKDEDEILLAEADTSGALDTNFVTPTFSKADDLKYLKEVERRRGPLFTHQTAIEAYDRLKAQRRAYYA